MPVSVDELNQATSLNFPSILKGHGITANTFAGKLKQELDAKETRIIKVKGGVPDVTQGTHRTYKVIQQGGEFRDGVIAIDMINWPVRQAARIDAQKLLNLYPAKEVKVKGDPESPSPVQMTNIPQMPSSIDEWQKEVEEDARYRRVIPLGMSKFNVK